MNLIENYNTSKQKYGLELTDKMVDSGIQPKYLLSACRFYTENGVQIPTLVLQFKEWNQYVAQNYPKIDVNKVQYERFQLYLNNAKLQHCVPNPVIVTKKGALGRLDTVKDARKIPVESDWCIKARGKFESIMKHGDELYAIYLPKESPPFAFTIALIQRGDVTYFDSNNQRQYEHPNVPTMNAHQIYQNKLPKEIVDYLYNRAANQMDNKHINCNRDMNKKLIRLTESDLHRIVRESVNRVLNEHQHPNDIKQMYLDFLDGEGYSKEAVEKIAEKMAEKGIESLKDGNREVLCIAFDQNDNLMYSLMQRGWKHIRR